MKKSTVLFFIVLSLFLLIGCINTEVKQPEIDSESLVGHIVIEGNALYLDKVEIITLEDVERIKELGLIQQSDLPNGYHIHNPDIEKVTYKLTDETVYNFVDFHLLFVTDEDEDRAYTTTKKEEFIQHLSTSYSDVPPAQKVPFFIEVKDGKVISITERFEFTI